MTKDIHPSGSSQNLQRSSGSITERTTGLFPLPGAALDANQQPSAVHQQLEEAKEANASLKKELNTVTKTIGCLQQHSRNLMQQLQREVSRSHRLEQQLMDSALLQADAVGSLSTEQGTGTGACRAEAVAQEEASVASAASAPVAPVTGTDVSALSSSLAPPAVALAQRKAPSACDREARLKHAVDLLKGA